MVPETIKTIREIVATYPNKLQFSTPENFEAAVDQIDLWVIISMCCKLSEDFIREFQDKVAWYFISSNQKLSIEFIKEFEDKIIWDCLSKSKELSEDIIREFKDKVSWETIVETQVLSENFIREFKDKVNWEHISGYQKLSEDFIREFRTKVIWYGISSSQKLSEDFIREFQNKVDWDKISKYQKLSENFIREFKNKVYWPYISKYQKLSEDFIQEFGLSIDYDSWMYKDTEFKKDVVIKTGHYKCYDDYFIAYKGIRHDRHSVFNLQFHYLPGNTYESHADFTGDENSFGLSAWAKRKVEKFFFDGIIIRVKIRYEDVARIVVDNGKIRCTKFEVLD